jgi:hypothetical protein
MITLEQLIEDKAEFGKELKKKRKAKYKLKKGFRYATRLENRQIDYIEQGNANYTIDTLINYLRGLK